MTYRLEDPERKHFEIQTVYLAHGAGMHTLAVFGMQAMLRVLALEGHPRVIAFEWEATAYDLGGLRIANRTFRTRAEDDFFIESSMLLEPMEDQVVNGSIYIAISAVEFQESPVREIAPAPRNFNGIYINFRPGNFVTGVHLYHSMMSYGLFRTAGFYAKRQVRDGLAVLGGRSDLSNAEPYWQGDAIGASAIRAGSKPGSKALVILHNDNPYPGAGGGSFLELRDASLNAKRRSVPRMGRHATLKQEFDSEELASSSWNQVLCAKPPMGLSRFLTGEIFPDGSFCVDHTYFQQPRDSTWGKVAEVRFFPKSLLSDSIIGPSNPWVCLHTSQIRSEVLVFNQFFPDQSYSFDLRVFDEAGTLVLCMPDIVEVAPYGMVSIDISAHLDANGHTELSGTYVISYGRASSPSVLPSRLHAEGVYHFSDGYWSAVQSDASIWSTPETAIPEIEALSGTRVRRRQLWYAVAVENAELETLIAISNLSYDLRYDHTQTVLVSLCSGLETVEVTEVAIPPFGAILKPLSELFPRHFPNDGRARFNSVSIFPKTGKTYCASFLVRDRRTKQFAIEHVLPMSKFAHEK